MIEKDDYMSKKNKEFNPVYLLEEVGFGAVALKNEIQNNKKNKGGILRGSMLRVLFVVFYTITLVLVAVYTVVGFFARKK